MSARVVVIDYGSGNLRSVEKAAERAVLDAALDARVLVTSHAADVRDATHIVLPGVGAFADCMSGLSALPGMVDALTEGALRQGKPFLGICVGMQLLATVGREHGDFAGLGWIKGAVTRLAPADHNLKVPHMGWNELTVTKPHPVLSHLNGAHAYFVHSFHFLPDDAADIATVTDYGGRVVAAVARDNLVGTQFHPEKSQAVGLQLLERFVRWRP